MGKRKSFFITFEGIDGSGLSTHSSLLRDWLVEKDFQVILTAEPTEGPIGALIRQILRGFVNMKKRPDILALLYAADRIYHVYELPYGTTTDEARMGIRNAMQEGRVVISNRYLISSLAYQSVPFAGSSIDLDWIDKINHPATNGMPVPDLVIFLDVPPKVSMQRINIGRQRYELFENYDDLQKVYERFGDALARYSLWPIVRVKGVTSRDRTKPVKEVQNEIRRKVQETILSGVKPSEKTQTSLIQTKEVGFGMELIDKEMGKLATRVIEP